MGNQGSVTVIIDYGLKEPYIGQANLVTGEIAEDLALIMPYQNNSHLL